MLSFIFGALIFSALGLDFESAIGVAASSLGNVGPALGNFGPLFSYSELPLLGKWWASFLMLLFSIIQIFKVRKSLTFLVNANLIVSGHENGEIKLWNI